MFLFARRNSLDKQIREIPPTEQWAKFCSFTLVANASQEECPIPGKNSVLQNKRKSVIVLLHLDTDFFGSFVCFNCHCHEFLESLTSKFSAWRSKGTAQHVTESGSSSRFIQICVGIYALAFIHHQAREKHLAQLCRYWTFERGNLIKTRLLTNSSETKINLQQWPYPDAGVLNPDLVGNDGNIVGPWKDGESVRQ